MDICSCLVIIIIIIIVTIALKKQSADKKTDSAYLTDKIKAAPSYSEIKGDLDIKIPADPHLALIQGKKLLAQGKRAEAVAFLNHVLRKGPPGLSQEASQMLEELGEIEVF